jgi:putative flippase GtrA
MEKQKHLSETTETLPPESLETSTGGLAARVRALLQHKEFERFWKFAVVGAIGAVVDFGTFTALRALGWLDPVEIVLPLGTLTGLGTAGAIAFILAVISNFIWNRYWTYPDSRTKPIATQLFTFFVVNVVGIIIRIPILETLSHPLKGLVHRIFPGLSEGTALWFGENGAWAIAVVLVMFWNFFVNRYWTYNDVD